METTVDPTPDESTPIPSWLPTECLSVGADRIGEMIDSQLETSWDAVGTALSSRDDRPLVVQLVTLLNREGDVILEPSVTFEAVADVTPRSVIGSFVVDGRSYSRSVPVWVREMVIRED